jgi:hypothetical protein
MSLNLFILKSKCSQYKMSIILLRQHLIYNFTYCLLNAFFKYSKSIAIYYNASLLYGNVLDSCGDGHAIESWTSWNSLLFHAAAIFLFCTVKRITLTNVVYSAKICCHTSSQTLVPLPPYKFVRPPCLYYWLQEIKRYDFRIVSIVINFVPNFDKIHPAVPEFNHADRRTDTTGPTCVHFVPIMQITHNNCLCPVLALLDRFVRGFNYNIKYI